ncbi:MAG TPA: Os1348 family NHLP clan protein [Vicinamibacterales bacterium]|nr:Os1348 family NHLP clan protein [Vicinamibacterales bacterium]
MTQRWIEIVIGKLVTDAALRDAFLAAPHDTLRRLVDHGVHLTRAEIAALVAIDPRLWTSTAEHIDLTLLETNADTE